MSYLRKIEYKIVPKQSFKIKHNCAGCGCKTLFINANSFRVNANGNKLDVWLIYKCERCKHTLNLPIYKRKSPHQIPQEEYQAFLRNDEAAAAYFGRQKSFFAGNGVQIEWKEMSYEYVDRQGESIDLANQPKYQAGDMICIQNECDMKIRNEKIAADILQCSRSQVNKMVESGAISISANHSQVTISI